MKTSNILMSVTLLLILLFTYTAVSKVTAMETFSQQMHNQPFPEVISSSLIWFIPVMELLTAALLIVKPLRFIGFCCAFVLMSLFTGYVAMILLDVFDRVPCSCGGILESLSWTQHLAVNFLFWLLSLTGILLENRKTIFMVSNKISR